MSKQQRRRAAQSPSREEVMEKKGDIQKEQETLRQAFNANGDLSRGWMREILGIENLEQILEPETIHKIQSMFNVQWVVANLTDAETHDRIYWMEVMKYKVSGEHPPQESRMTGDFRGFIFDDPDEAVEPLTPVERNAIDQIIKGLQNMVTRSRGGFEREQINTNIARTENQSEGDDDGQGGLRGLFS